VRRSHSLGPDGRMRPIELGSNVPTNLDLCRLEIPGKRFMLSFAPLPFVYESLIDADGGYVLHLLIAADEAKAVKAVVRVGVQKAADDMSVELLEPRPRKPGRFSR
jgi:hypothetical protein